MLSSNSLTNKAPNALMKKIGIYGGSFNPIHTGHISLAKQIINIAKLDEVWFVVSPQNPFKQNSLSLISDEISSQHPDAEFNLIIGADNWAVFDKWYHATDIIQNYPIIVYPREGYDLDATTMPSGIRLVDTQLYPISSTMIRTMVAEGNDITGLVPEAIKQDIYRIYGCTKKLYPSSG